MLAQTLPGKDREDAGEEPEPLSAVQLALRRQQAQQQQQSPPGFPAAVAPQHTGTGAAPVAAASSGHLHMPFFEKVDISEFF